MPASGHPQTPVSWFATRHAEERTAVNGSEEAQDGAPLRRVPHYQRVFIGAEVNDRLYLLPVAERRFCRGSAVRSQARNAVECRSGALDGTPFHCVPHYRRRRNRNYLGFSAGCFPACTFGCVFRVAFLICWYNSPLFLLSSAISF